MKVVSEPPQLVLCASTWSMTGWPTPGREWSLGRKLDAIHEAGFDGVTADITPAIKAGAARRGLKLMGGFNSSHFSVARRRLLELRSLGVRFINIQLLGHQTPPKRAAAMAVRLLRLSRRLGLAVHIETHRDTCTETPEKLTEIARLYRRATGGILPVTWDHSHLAVIKHLQPEDYASRLLVWPKEIQHSQMFHLRPFSGQHAQVPVTNGRGRLTPEFTDYLAFAEELFAFWLRGPQPGGQLWACPELGMTHGYHVSTNPPVWPDVIRCRAELHGAWKRALRRTT